MLTRFEKGGTLGPDGGAPLLVLGTLDALRASKLVGILLGCEITLAMPVELPKALPPTGSLEIVFIGGPEGGAALELEL